MKKRFFIIFLLSFIGTFQAAAAEKVISLIYASQYLDYLIKTDEFLSRNYPFGRVIKVASDGVKATVFLSAETLPLPGFIDDYDYLQNKIYNQLSELYPDLRDFEILFETNDGEFRTFDYFYGRLSDKIFFPPPPDSPPVICPRKPGGGGALNNKRIIINPSRGAFHDGTVWKYRIGEVESLQVDLVTSRIVTYHLIPLLEGAGAYVYNTRERDVNETEGIIDNGDLWFSKTGTWSEGANPGGYNPNYSPPYLYAPTAATGDREARFIPTFPKPGWYDVYIWYVQDANRAQSAKHIVRHAGGDSVILVNQTINGSRWNHIGRHYFNGGSGQGVIISNESAETGKYVVADAVRFGGGMGSIKEGGAASGMPRWHEGARYWTWFLGAPDIVYNSQTTNSSSDTYARPLYANWQGGDAFLTVTTNAFAGATTGSETYMHTTGNPAGSQSFRDAVHSKLIEYLQIYDPTWTDRGKKSGDYIELREVSGMPAATTYVAFHDGVAGVNDNLYLKDPKFRRAAGRGIANGIIKHFVPTAAALPDAPAELRAKSVQTGVEVVWNAVSGATGYNVYVGKRGRGFGEAISVTATSYTIPALTEGENVFVAVSAKNAAGEGYKSKTIAARKAPAAPTGKLLIVNAFNRWDRRVDETNNTFDYTVEHLLAVPSGWDVGGATGEAVASGSVALADWNVVDVVLGQESTADETFSKAEQALYTTYLNAGGRLFISGSEIGWDLHMQGDAEDQAFYSGKLKAEFAQDDCAGCYQVTAVAGTFFESLGTVQFSDGTDGVYDVPYPDQIRATQNGVEVLKYPIGSAAMVAYKGSDFRVVNFAIPFEAVIPAAKRVELMALVLDFLISEDTPPEDAGVEDTGEQDTGEQDIGEQDTGEQDTGEQDTGIEDAGEQDTGEPDDSGVTDAGEEDTGVEDIGEQDAGEEDIGEEEAGEEDTGEEEDIGDEDAGEEDSGEEDIGTIEEDAGEGEGDDDNDDNGASNNEDNDDSGKEGGKGDSGGDDWLLDDDDGIKVGYDGGRKEIDGGVSEDTKVEGGCGCRVR
ncbi:MAG: hypothetical protein Kow0090_03050 [Myxococcota bacterium]